MDPTMLATDIYGYGSMQWDVQILGKTHDAPTFAMPVLHALTNAMVTARLDGSRIELLTQA